MPVEGKENFCFVILLHRNPDVKSNLVSILQKKCQWTVKLISNNTKPKPSTVYVAPADDEVHFENGNFILKKASGDSITPSINKFFTSLAREKKILSMGVILSGTGKDGSNGIKKIREQGGDVICQIPATGTSTQMPQSAIDTSTCDNILRPYIIYTRK